MANVDWLERAQIKPGDRMPWPGTWTYQDQKFQPGDNSNTQYALLGLNAASEAGVVVRPEVWALSRALFRADPEPRRRLGLHAAAASSRPPA